MARDGFQVDLDALGAAGDRVRRLAEELSGTFRDIPSATVFGHDQLDEAANKFEAQGQRGAAQLASETESIRRRLAETIEAYRKADEDGASRLRDISS